MKKLSLTLLIPLSFSLETYGAAQAHIGPRSRRPSTAVQAVLNSTTGAVVETQPKQQSSGSATQVVSAEEDSSAMYQSIPEDIQSQQASSDVLHSTPVLTAAQQAKLPTQEEAFGIVAEQLKNALVAHTILKTAKRASTKTKHGYSFSSQETIDPTRNIHPHTDFNLLAKRWNFLVQGMRNGLNPDYERDTELASLRAKIYSLQQATFSAPQQTEHVKITCASALRKYQKSPLLNALQAEFAAQEWVTQKDVDTFAKAIELPVEKALELHNNSAVKTVLQNYFYENQAPTREFDATIRGCGLSYLVQPAQVDAFAAHATKFTDTVKALTTGHTDLKTVVCHGADVFQDPITGDKMNFGHVDVDGADATRLLQLANTTAMTALSSGRLNTLKEDKTAILSRLSVVEKELSDLSAKIQSQSKDPKATAAVLGLKRQSDELAIEKAGLTQLAENMTIARAFQKDLLLQLAANTDTPIEKVPTITWLQQSRWNVFTGVTLPGKTTENPYQARKRIAFKIAAEHHKGTESAKYAAALRLLLNNDDFNAYVTTKKEAARTQQAENSKASQEQAAKDALAELAIAKK